MNLEKEFFADQDFKNKKKFILDVAKARIEEISELILTKI